MKKPCLLAALFAMVALPAAPAPAPPTMAELQKQVRESERAFAKTMADRDHAAFASFVAEDSVFLSGPNRALRGRKAVADGWKRLYEGPEAPFSWEPETVEVLDSGALGLSSGPVYDRQGKRAGTFNSIWRREADGKWKVIFDNGCPPCPCEPGPPPGAPRPPSD
jgi:ketosteroid isomerase-like protein